jgi:TonB-linked SusC/RagA family outer membrane protein
MPVYDENGKYYDYNAKTKNGWNYDASAVNPIANYALSPQGLNLSKNHNLQASAYVQIQPIKGLILKSQFGYKMSASTYRSYDMIRNLSSTSNTTTETVSHNASLGASWTLDNTLTYKLQLADHVIDAVVGQSAEKWGLGDNVSASGKNTLFPGSWKNAYVDNTKPTALDQITAGSSPWGEGDLASFFGRVNYNYKEKYMASATLRADGSSNFAPGKQWGYFPSVSAGWVISSESFMKATQNFMDFLKLRASWGQNGNCNIDGYQYLTTFSFDVTNGYYFGKDKSSQTTGSYANILKNPDVTWETSEQLDLGLDARFLRNRLGVAFDWYKKTTKDWLVKAPILSTYGLNAPYINGGDVDNKGFELALNWNDYVGKDFKYSLNFNLSQNKNKVTRIANAEGIIHGDANVLSQGTDEMYRAQVGYPIGYFYGYKTDGVFQNYDQIAAYKAAGNGVLAGAQPGDVIFVDTNHDGVITEADRTQIGDPHPDFNVGLGINLSYKGFDLSIAGTGAFGQQIAKSYRSFASGKNENYTTDIFGVWTGEGTSNKLPRLTSGSNSNWQNISDIYIENGDYLKIQNVTIGYDFKRLFHKLPLQQARLYFTVQNLYTFTGYSGMDPEIGYGNARSWVSGIDLGFYPTPRTYLVGVNLKF